MGKWISVGQYGLRYREHATKTTGVGKNKRPLRYYTSVYKWREKTVTDVYGLEGEDFKNEDDIVAVAIELRQNRRNMQPPFTLKEKMGIREAALIEAEEATRQKENEKVLEEATKVNSVFSSYCDNSTHKVSLKDEQNYFKNWIGPAIGDKKLSEVVLLDLERIRKKMTAAGNAPRTIGYIKSIVRQIYHYGKAHNLYNGEPPTTHFLNKQKIDNKRQRYLTVEEAESLLARVREYSEETYQVTLLSLHTGMRFGEIAALQWQHVSIDGRRMLVVDPKNGESRSVFMTERVHAMFENMTEGRPDEIVFPSKKGGKRTRVSKSFAKAVDDLGLNYGITDRRMEVVYHSIRHSCASILVNSGVSIPVIAQILGHKTLAMTMRYAHINNTSVKNAMAILDEKPAQSMEKVTPLIQKAG
jgi:integrase